MRQCIQKWKIMPYSRHVRILSCTRLLAGERRLHSHRCYYRSDINNTTQVTTMISLTTFCYTVEHISHFTTFLVFHDRQHPFSMTLLSRCWSWSESCVFAKGKLKVISLSLRTCRYIVIPNCLHNPHPFVVEQVLQKSLIYIFTTTTTTTTTSHLLTEKQEEHYNLKRAHTFGAETKRTRIYVICARIYLIWEVIYCVVQLFVKAQATLSLRPMPWYHLTLIANIWQYKWGGGRKLVVAFVLVLVKNSQ